MLSQRRKRSRSPLNKRSKKLSLLLLLKMLSRRKSNLLMKVMMNLMFKKQKLKLDKRLCMKLRMFKMKPRTRKNEQCQFENDDLG